MRGAYYSELLPDLRQVPYDRWAEALLPLSFGARNFAYQGDPERASSPEADAVREELRRLEAARAQVLRTARLARPDTAAAAPSASRQISLRFVRTEFAELEAAAAARGLNPGRLARLLIRSGVSRILYVECRER